MTTSPGTFEGKKEEIDLVRKVNMGYYNKFFFNYLYQIKDYFCIRLTKHRLSNLSGIKVAPKSDAVLIKTEEEIKKLLDQNEHYLDEDILNTQGIKFRFVSNSGISIKRSDSKNYQIHKFTPNSFFKIFQDNCLGAGAMIYSMKEKDLKKNKVIIEDIWNVKEAEFFEYFYKNINELSSDMDSKKKYIKIQKYCLSKIKEIINNNPKIKTHIFTGKKDFEEPFCATFSLINNKLESFRLTDFYISQGSGRIKTPTIVVKPK